MHTRAECRHEKTFVPFLRIVLISLTLSQCAGVVQAGHTVQSPDGNVVVTFDATGQEGNLMYSVAFEGRPVVVDSRLGLALKDAASLETGFEISSVSRSNHDSIYSPVYAELPAVSRSYSYFGKLEFDLRLDNRSRMNREVHVRFCERR